MYREVAFSIGKQTSEEEKNTVMAAQKDPMSLKKITENYLYGDSMSSEGKAYPKSQFLDLKFHTKPDCSLAMIIALWCHKCSVGTIHGVNS